MSVNEDAADVLIGHRLELLRYEAGAAEELVAVYERAFSDVLAALRAAEARNAAPSTLDRLRVSLGALDARLRDALRLASETLDARLAEAGTAEATLQSGRLSRAIGIDLATVPEERVLAMLHTPLGGEAWSSRLATDLYTARNDIVGALARGLAEGASVPRLARMLREATAIHETYRGRMVAIARTEVQRIANDVAMASYAANDDILSGVQWLATLDTRTCLVCAPRHNEVYRLTGLDRRPPLHPRCRCFLTPVVRPWSELGGRVPRAARGAYTGQPANDTDFDAWLRRKPAAVAREVLGDARYALWRDGVALDRFTDGRRVLRLGELSALAA